MAVAPPPHPWNPRRSDARGRCNLLGQDNVASRASGAPAFDLSREDGTELHTIEGIRTLLQTILDTTRLIQQIRAIALEVGHTPTQAELMERDIYHAELARYFGTAAEAMGAAGLEPNVRGNPPRPLPVDLSRREEGT